MDREDERWKQRKRAVRVDRERKRGGERKRESTKVILERCSTEQRCSADIISCFNFCVKLQLCRLELPGVFSTFVGHRNYLQSPQNLSVSFP